MKITTIGLDLAKTVFQVHGIDVDGTIVWRRSLRRGQMLTFFSRLDPCLVGMEACATSHYWARELIGLGHDVKLMPPAYVKPYVKRGKTDAGDAEAICEAVTRPTMRFVPVKTAEQQSVIMVHRTREVLERQRTQLVNILRGQLAEFGVVLARGLHHALKIARQLAAGEMPDIPELAITVTRVLAEQVQQVHLRIAELEKDLKRWFRTNHVAQSLTTIPGIGVLTASALASTVIDPHQFTSGRQFAAWLGLVPRANSSGGKHRQGRISKMGDRHIRRLLVSGMTSQLQSARRHPDDDPWVSSMLVRKPPKLVAVAMANKAARIAWAVMTRGEVYRAL
jgi:transposase